MKSILNTLDIFMGHLAAGVMTFLLYISFGCIAGLSLIAIPAAFFEYGFGIDELDLTEIGSVVLFGLVTWRFFRRGSLQQWSKWQLIRRFICVVAITSLIVTFILFFMFVAVIITKGTIELSSLYRFDEFITLLSNLIMIAAIYAAAPLAPFYNSAHEKNSTVTTSTEKLTPEDEAGSADSQSTGKEEFEEKLKNYRAPENPWEKA
ncbi:hypothetical protein ACROAE_03360 [Shewanella sp. MF05960]|uniref:hypothetical protein n=1 Tax=Shewanella sp. MF05960 TaxID=3434874 RepID=UPI003D798801